MPVLIELSSLTILGPDGLTGDVTESPRPLKEGETMEWVLVAGVSRIRDCAVGRAHCTRRPLRAPTSGCTTYTQARSTW